MLRWEDHKSEVSRLGSKPVLSYRGRLSRKDKQDETTRGEVVDRVCFAITSNECFLTTHWKANPRLAVAKRAGLGGFFQIIQLPEGKSYTSAGGWVTQAGS